MLPCGPAFPHEPDVKVQNSGGMGKCSNGMTLHRYSMLIDFFVESFAEGDNICAAILGPGTFGAVRSKPKVDAIKKMKTRGIDHRIRIGVNLGAEEEGRCEDSLKALNHSPVMTTIGSKTKEIEHLDGSIKADDTAFLLDSQGGHPYGDQAVLPEGDGPFIMHLPQ